MRWSGKVYTLVQETWQTSCGLRVPNTKQGSKVYERKSVGIALLKQFKVETWIKDLVGCFQTVCETLPYYYFGQLLVLYLQSCWISNFYFLYSFKQQHRALPVLGLSQHLASLVHPLGPLSILSPYFPFLFSPIALSQSLPFYQKCTVHQILNSIFYFLILISLSTLYVFPETHFSICEIINSFPVSYRYLFYE